MLQAKKLGLASQSPSESSLCSLRFRVTTNEAVLESASLLLLFRFQVFNAALTSMCRSSCRKICAVSKYQSCDLPSTTITNAYPSPVLGRGGNPTRFTLSLQPFGLCLAALARRCLGSRRRRKCSRTAFNARVAPLSLKTNRL